MSAPALVLLAAGAAERLGRCKALAELGDAVDGAPPATPLTLLLAAAADLDTAPPLVITGADHEAIAAAAPDGVEVARNPRWAEGRSGSILRARNLRPGYDLCLAPVDVPLVGAPVFAALAAAWLAAGAPARGWLAPATPDGRPGHPVVLGRDLLAAFEPTSLDEPLRSLRERAQPLWTTPVDSPAIHDDLDTPEDLVLLRLRLEAGR